MLDALELGAALERWEGEEDRSAFHVYLIAGAKIAPRALRAKLDEDGLVLCACAGCRRSMVAEVGAPARCPGCRGTLEAVDLSAPSVRRPAAPVFGERFRVVELLGRGGEGRVYLADDLQDGGRIALKVMRSDRHGSARGRARFEREGRLLSSLVHPNLVRVLATAPADERPYLAMEFVEGQTFEDALRPESGTPRRRALQILEMVARGVAHAHAQGVVHRDLKPSNVLIDGEGTARVTDFGLAKHVESETMVTVSGDAIGTPAYMAPEAIEADADLIGPPADVYALGVMLYRVLVGSHPFAGAAGGALMRRVLNEVVPAPSAAASEPVPPALDALCVAATRREPSDRPADAGAFHAALQRALAPPASEDDLLPILGWVVAALIAGGLAFGGLLRWLDIEGPVAQAPGSGSEQTSAGDGSADAPGSEVAAGSGSESAAGSGSGSEVASGSGSEVARAEGFRWRVAHELPGAARILALSAERVVIQAGTTLRAFDLAGERRWSRTLEHGDWQVRRDGDQLLATDGKRVRAIGITDGELRWTLAGRHPELTALDAPVLDGDERLFVVARGRLLMLGRDGRVANAPGVLVKSAPADLHQRGRALAVLYADARVDLIEPHSGLPLLSKGPQTLPPLQGKKVTPARRIWLAESREALLVLGARWVAKARLDGGSFGRGFLAKAPVEHLDRAHVLERITLIYGRSDQAAIMLRPFGRGAMPIGHGHHVCRRGDASYVLTRRGSRLVLMRFGWPPRDMSMVQSLEGAPAGIVSVGDSLLLAVERTLVRVDPGALKVRGKRALPAAVVGLASVGTQTVVLDAQHLGLLE